MAPARVRTQAHRGGSAAVRIRNRTAAAPRRAARRSSCAVGLAFDGLIGVQALRTNSDRQRIARTELYGDVITSSSADGKTDVAKR